MKKKKKRLPKEEYKRKQEIRREEKAKLPLKEMPKINLYSKPIYHIRAPGGDLNAVLNVVALKAMLEVVNEATEQIKGVRNEKRH